MLSKDGLESKCPLTPSLAHSHTPHCSLRVTRQSPGLLPQQVGAQATLDGGAGRQCFPRPPAHGSREMELASSTGLHAPSESSFFPREGLHFVFSSLETSTVLPAQGRGEGKGRRNRGPCGTHRTCGCPSSSLQVETRHERQENWVKLPLR